VSYKDFLNKKIKTIIKDGQMGDFVEPLQEMMEAGDEEKAIRITPDGNWFKVSFDAVQVKKDRLLISAKKVTSHQFDQHTYSIGFEGTRAAYLWAKVSQPRFHGWSYLHWDVRAYREFQGHRVYVREFRAREELKTMIREMESMTGVRNIFNSYINDNFNRIKHGVEAGKNAVDLEKEWSKGLFEGLGYRHCEVDLVGDGGQIMDVNSHWCKDEHDLKGMS
jgi:hypothetical protein